MTTAPKRTRNGLGAGVAVRLIAASRLAVVCLVAGWCAFSGATAYAGGALNYDEAVSMLLSRSDALAGAKANVEGKAHTANSLDYLDYPRVGIDAKALDSEKTVKVDLSKAKSEASSILPLLSETYGSAIASEIPSNAVFGVHNSGVQSNITATLPLYMGGKIDASQKAAAAGVRAAGAELTLTEQKLRTELAHVYFLYQLALRVRDVRIEVRDGLRLHLENARHAEKAGITSHAQTLQAQVAYDETVRNLVKAESDVHSAGVALANLLHVSAPPLPSTPLFVSARSPAPLRSYIDTALEKHGQLARLAAMDTQAGEGVRIERAARLPQVYAFGEYNIAGRNWDLTTPDWAFGLAVHYDLFSGIDRSEAEKAAVKTQFQVQAAIRQTRLDLETAVTTAYNDLTSARERFLLLESNIASAQENVRTQDASFRAGYATTVDVVDARLALSRARIDRAEAAFQYDDALARLLAASGQAETYGAYIAKADRVIAK